MHFVIKLAALAASLFAVTAAAHHSYAMFDQSKTLTLSGTVKEFQFTSPHAWIQLMVPEAAGGEAEWGVEMSSSGALLRRGWSKKTVRPGDKITVVVNPLRDGSSGGNFVSANFADGARVGPVPRPAN